MKFTSLFLILLLLPLTSFPGVGGIDGGSVFFQGHSIFVNALTNQTLCVEDEVFIAEVNECLTFKGLKKKNCISKEKVEITQPIKSTIRRCKKRNETGCRKPQDFENVPYIQEPELQIQYKERNRIIREETYIVPSC